jgi:hypothetical protein
VLIFSIAPRAVELLTISKKLQNISGTHAATWGQKLAADFSYFFLLENANMI